MNVINGSITIRGTNRKDVAIETTAQRWTGRTRSQTSARPRRVERAQATDARIRSTFIAEQDANAITIQFRAVRQRGLRDPGAEPDELAPHDRQQAASWSRAWRASSRSPAANGPITLRNVTGSVVANTVNGNLTAVMPSVTAQKAMAFSAFNGDVDVTLPSSIKANLRLHSYQGDVFTNFDLDIKPAPPASAAPAAPAARAPAVPPAPGAPRPPAAPAPPVRPRSAWKETS